MRLKGSLPGLRECLLLGLRESAAAKPRTLCELGSAQQQSPLLLWQHAVCPLGSHILRHNRSRNYLAVITSAQAPLSRSSPCLALSAAPTHFISFGWVLVLQTVKAETSKERVKLL